MTSHSAAPLHTSAGPCEQLIRLLPCRAVPITRPVSTRRTLTVPGTGNRSQPLWFHNPRLPPAQPRYACLLHGDGDVVLCTTPSLGTAHSTRPLQRWHGVCRSPPPHPNRRFLTCCALPVSCSSRRRTPSLHCAGTHTEGCTCCAVTGGHRPEVHTVLLPF